MSRGTRNLLLGILLGLLLGCALLDPVLATPLPIPRTGAPLDVSAGPSVPAEDRGNEPLPLANESSRADMASSAHIPPAEILRRSSPAIVTVMSTLPHEGAVRGTGFFANARGLVITSHHLVDQARLIKIKTRDGKLYNTVKVIAARPEVDVAVLEVTDLKVPRPFLPLGDSELVRVGEPIVVIGHPLGLEYTLSSGLVSALRAAEINGLDLIQFSAPVSPGCSGGPIINSGGQVIGVVCLSHPEGQNLNFAIPINYPRQLLARLERGNGIAAAMRDLDGISGPLAHAVGSAAGHSGEGAPGAQPLHLPSSVNLVPETPTVMLSPTASRRVFRVGSRGFAIDCPTSWTCHCSRGGDNLTIQMESADGLIHVDLVTVALRPTTSLKDFATRTVRSLNSTILAAALDKGGAKLVREYQCLTGGLTWKMYVHRFTDADDNDAYGVTMLSVSDAQGYMVRYTAPVNAWNRLRAYVEQVVASAYIF